MPLSTDREWRGKASPEAGERNPGARQQEHVEPADSRRESEARFRTFAEAAADGILLHDGRRILSANSCLLELTGYSLPELRALELVDLVVAGDRDLARRRIAERATEPYEVTCLRKDGATRPVTVRAGDITYAGVAARAVWLRDLSEREEVLGALRRSEGRYRQLFETCPEGIYVSTLDRRFMAVNPAMVRLFGYGSEREMLELDPEALYFEQAHRQEFLKRLFVEGSIHDFPALLRTRDGGRLEVRETANLVRDDRGQAAGYQGILRDVTEQRRLERQLAQAQRMEAVGSLAGGVAHDFNNLLTAITGFSHLALAALEPGHRAACDLREVQRAAERATRLTEQLLSFSRREVLTPEHVDLNAVVGGLQSFLERTLGSDIEIVLDLEERLAPVLADGGQIEQVLMNLAINSRAAMPEGGRLEIRSRSERVGRLEQVAGRLMQPGDYSLLVVADDGCGMDKDTRDRAFDPFFTTKEESGGTGLGLATVYGIVKQSNGYVQIDSAPGAGATFTIYLPQAKARAVPTPEAEPLTPRNLGTETVLLVEDDESLREFSRRCLESRGYEVLLACDASEARAVFARASERIAIMVSDVVMPHGSGVRLGREIQAGNPEIAILLVSGLPGRVRAHDPDEASAFPLLAKPFSAKALTETVRRLLDGS